MAITKGGVCFTFFDAEKWVDFNAYYPVIKNVFPQWKGNFFTNAWGTLTPTEKSQMLAAQAVGMEIHNHSTNHFDAYDYLTTHTEEQYYTNEVEAQQNAMIAAGITPPTVFAYASGEGPRTLSNLIISKNTAIKLVMHKTCGIFSDPAYSKGYYKSMFAQGNGGIGHEDINSDSSRLTFDIKYILQQLEYCKNNNDVYIHSGHNINQTGSGQFANSWATIQAISRYVACNGMKFYGMSELVAAGFVGTARTIPSVAVIIVTGTQSSGNNLTATYVYQHDSDVAESGTTFQWYRATDTLGTGVAPIGGATALVYGLTGADTGKFVRLGITTRTATEVGHETFTKWFAIS